MNEYVLEQCPICGADGMLMHEGGWNVQVECTACGAHSVYVEYSDESGKKAAEQQVVQLWNMGKVIHTGNGD